jgi:hypothetical protein
MGLEKQTQEIGLKVRGFVPRSQKYGCCSCPYNRGEVYLPAMSAVMPAVCFQDWHASLLCDGSLQHS